MTLVNASDASPFNRLIFPNTITLCGSTRYISTFQAMSMKLTLEGWMVLSVGSDTKSDDDLFARLPEAEKAALKTNLDWLHKRKIDMSNAIMVLNQENYVGDSTRSEIAYAYDTGKRILWLMPDTTGLLKSLAARPFIVYEAQLTGPALATYAARSGDPMPTRIWHGEAQSTDQMAAMVLTHLAQLDTRYMIHVLVQPVPGAKPSKSGDRLTGFAST